MESPHTPAKIKSFYINDLETAHLRYLSSQIVGSAKRRKLNSTRKGQSSCFVESMGSTSLSSTDEFNKSLAQSYIPPRSTKPLTEPVEFHFHTENRNKALPKPPSSPFVSLAQKVRQFHNKTPKRFRSMARNSRIILRPPSPPLQLTIPQEFTFETESRSRPTTVLSTQEREELEIQQMRKFVARSVNPKVLAGQSQMNTSVFQKSLTEIEEFHFQTEERAKLKKREVQGSPEPFKFTAVPVDESVLYGPVKGVPSLPQKVLTIPESPMLTTKYRAALQPIPVPTDPEVFVFKAQPMPISKPFAPTPLLDKILTVPEPFELSTDKRGKVAKEKLEKELQEEQFKAEQQRLFKAQPLPISEPFEITPYERHLTVPEPFHLESEERGERYQETVFKPTIEAERQKEIENTHFKALPFVPSTDFFQPGKSSKPLTVLDDVALNSEVRSQRRLQFDKRMAKKMQQADENKKRKEQEDQIEQQKELKQLRKKLVHKALPVMHAKPFVLKPTSDKLTKPATPNLRTRTRAALHNGRDI